MIPVARVCCIEDINIIFLINLFDKQVFLSVICYFSQVFKWGDAKSVKVDLLAPRMRIIILMGTTMVLTLETARK